MYLRCQDAPRDGRWILINYDHNADFEDWHIGRWKPETVKIGDQWITYEWQYITHEGAVDQLSDGRVCDWKPLPE